jgi:hypothetical protein
MPVAVFCFSLACGASVGVVGYNPMDPNLKSHCVTLFQRVGDYGQIFVQQNSDPDVDDPTASLGVSTGLD